MDYAERVEIAARLGSEMNSAKCAYEAATSRFDAILKDVPSAIPSPDGGLRIRQAGEESRRALRAYMDTMKRYTEFKVRGVVPEGVLQK